MLAVMLLVPARWLPRDRCRPAIESPRYRGPVGFSWMGTQFSLRHDAQPPFDMAAARNSTTNFEAADAGASTSA
jgi:hypothetical protein